jgi:hypothetical protein
MRLKKRLRVETMGQLTLMSTKEDYEKAFEDGEIVAQTWAWIGSFQAVFPFWQVRYSEIIDGVRQYYCSAVPYGSHPCEIQWFHRKDLRGTGFKWRIPSFDELDELCKKHPERHMDMVMNNTIKALDQTRREDDKDWYCYFYPSYPEEKELVDFLNSTGIDYKTVTRDNFEEKMKPLLERKI